MGPENSACRSVGLFRRGKRDVREAQRVIMKTGFFRTVAACVALSLVVPATVYAGFDIDPSVTVALDAANRPATQPGSVPATTATTATALLAHPSAPPATQLASSPSATVGGAMPATAVSASTLALPSSSWDLKVQGFGRNEPLRQALSHVIPINGQLIVTGTLPLPEKHVSWDGSSSRISIARKMLADVGLEGRFDGDNLLINVAGTTGSTASAVDPSTVPRQWTIPRGVMLSDGLADWIEQSGAYGEHNKWSMDWKAYDPLTGDKIDYPVPAPIHLYGTIDQAAAQLIWLYRKSKRPLHIDISKEQRFIHISLRGS